MSGNREVAVELARIVGKLEAGKKLTALETLMLLPYYYVEEARRKIESARQG